MTEAAILKAILLEAPKRGCRLMRNTRGAYKEGERWIQYGLAKGASDLIGWKMIYVGPREIAVFLAVEVKTPIWEPRNAADKKRWVQQLRFIAAVKKTGGIAGVCRSVEEFRALVG